jgi:hypothetical protein
MEISVDTFNNDSTVLTDHRRFESRHLSDSLHHPITSMRLVQFSVDTSQFENKEEVTDSKIVSTKRSHIGIKLWSTPILVGVLHCFLQLLHCIAIK